MRDSQTLLAEYAETGSEAAFRELVARYLSLVYSTAHRITRGDAHAAEDVTQLVFIGLARRGRSLSRNVMLGGWLHQYTFHVGSKAVRAEQRRQLREQKALEMTPLQDDSTANFHEVTPMLDEAITQLGVEDRTAIVLRFFEQRDFRSIGAALGSKEDAARMRVGRALEKLHAILLRRGVTSSVAALAAGLAEGAAAPAGMAANLAGTALASAAGGLGTSAPLLKIMSLTNLKAGLVAAVVLAGVLTPFVMQHQTRADGSTLDDARRRGAAQIAQYQAQNQQFSNLLAQATDTGSLSDDQIRELLRLRNEAGQLRRRLQDSTQPRPPAPQSRTEMLAALSQPYSNRVARVQHWLEAHPSEKIPELQFLTDTDWLRVLDTTELAANEEFLKVAVGLRMNGQIEFVEEILFDALHRCVLETGQFPTDLAQLKPYLKSPVDDAVLQEWEIVPASSLPSNLQRLAKDESVITRKAAVHEASDQRIIVTRNSLALGPRGADAWHLVH